jgi:catalase
VPPEQSRAGTTLTDRQGAPVLDDANAATVGPRGPMVMGNFQFLEKIAHFDRERVPERVVHARGFVAHGTFTAYGTIGDEPAAAFTRAALFAEKGLQTPVTVRLSTVIGGKESPETLRDIRGFAVKFRTGAGNWDLVGNDIPVFFIRDAVKFPDLIHAFKPDPVTYQQDFDRIFDFLSLTPESNHVITWLFSPRGLPKDWFHMDGFGVNTYRFVDATGTTRLVKFHWRCEQGVECLTTAQAREIQGEDVRHASRYAYAAIEAGEYPSWELAVQVMSDDEHPELDFDPLDDTKTWPEDAFPLLPVGRMTLDRNVTNFHLENEELAFGTGNLVDGIALSDDKVLQGRTFSYGDTQRYRIGPNYQTLPVNLPRADVSVATGQVDGPMAAFVDSGDADPHVNYAPSSHGGLVPGTPPGPPADLPVPAGQVQQAPLPRRDDLAQARDRYRTMPQEERDDLVLNLVTLVGQARPDVQERCVAMFTAVDPDYGARVASGLGLSA